MSTKGKKGVVVGGGSTQHWGVGRSQRGGEPGRIGVVGAPVPAPRQFATPQEALFNRRLDSGEREDACIPCVGSRSVLTSSREVPNHGRSRVGRAPSAVASIQ